MLDGAFIAAAITTFGAALVVIAVRDMWVTLFRPTDQGAVSRAVIWGVWWGARRAAENRPARLKIAGPAATAAVLAVWATSLVLGWTLIFWAWMPEAFVRPQALGASANDFVEALYLSLLTLTTLGYGDTTPIWPWLRVLAPVESAFGFILLTAGISWVLFVYPALTRQRALAREVAILRETEEKTGLELSSLGSVATERALVSFTSQLLVVRSDLLQFPIIYHYYEDDPRSAVSVAIPYLLRLADTCAAGDADGILFHATQLRVAIDELAETLRKDFVEVASEDTHAVLAAFARDHLRDI